MQMRMRFFVFTQLKVADVDESQDSSSSEDEEIFELCKYEKKHMRMHRLLSW